MFHSSTIGRLGALGLLTLALAACPSTTTPTGVTVHDPDTQAQSALVYPSGFKIPTFVDVEVGANGQQTTSVIGPNGTTTSTVAGSPTTTATIAPGITASNFGNGVVPSVAPKASAAPASAAPTSAVSASPTGSTAPSASPSASTGPFGAGIGPSPIQDPTSQFFQSPSPFTFVGGS